MTLHTLFRDMTEASAKVAAMQAELDRSPRLVISRTRHHGRDWWLVKLDGKTRSMEWSLDEARHYARQLCDAEHLIGFAVRP